MKTTEPKTAQHTPEAKPVARKLSSYSAHSNSGDVWLEVASDTCADAERIHKVYAAAPELLAALIGAQSALRKAVPHLPPDDEAVYCGEWLDEINAAIAKATGQ